MKALFVSVLIILMGAFAGATVIPVDSSIKTVSIIGVKSNIRISGKEGSSYKLNSKKRVPSKVSGDIADANGDWTIRSEKIKGELRIRVDAPSDKRIWRSYIQKGGWPEFNLTLVGPSKPLTVFLRQGKVDISGWEKNITVTNLKGTISIQNSKGDLDLNLQSGQTRVKNHEGSLQITNFSSNVKMNQVTGNVELNNFSGSTLLQNIKGPVTLTGQNGLITVKDGEGNINFNSGKNRTVIENFEGAIKGKSQQGDVIVKGKGRLNINVKTDQGRVNIAARGSGASVNVGSKEGPLSLPNYLKLTRYANLKVMTGRLRGGAPGRVFVRTQSGAVRLK